MDLCRRSAGVSNAIIVEVYALSATAVSASRTETLWRMTPSAMSTVPHLRLTARCGFLPEPLLFQLGRMSHMSLSCVSCGMCEDACPVDIPVGRIFQQCLDCNPRPVRIYGGKQRRTGTALQEIRDGRINRCRRRIRALAMAQVLKINKGVTEGVTSLLRTLLEEKKVRAVLTLMQESPSGNVTYGMITGPGQAERRGALVSGHAQQCRGNCCHA